MIEPYEDHHPDIDLQAFVHPAAVVIGDVRIGPESSVWPCVSIRGDDGPIVIGSQTSIQDGSVVHNTLGHAYTTVGDRVTVGHAVVLHGCTIENECIIGMGAVILDNAHVEAGCIIGAGTVIPPGKRIAAGQVVIGNPMRVLRACTDQDRAAIDHGWREYVRRLPPYRKLHGPTPGGS